MNIQFANSLHEQVFQALMGTSTCAREIVEDIKAGRLISDVFDIETGDDGLHRPEVDEGYINAAEGYLEITVPLEKDFDLRLSLNPAKPELVLAYLGDDALQASLYDQLPVTQPHLPETLGLPSYLMFLRITQDKMAA